MSQMVTVEGNDATTRRDLTLTGRKFRSTVYYVPRLEVLPWVHALPVVVNLAIIAFGSLFLGNNNKNNISSSEGRNKGPFGVKIQMYCTIIK